MTFPIYFQLSDSIFLFKNETECLKVTNCTVTKKAEISEEETSFWIDVCIKVGHQVTRNDFAYAMQRATDAIGMYYSREIRHAFAAVTVYDNQLNIKS